jgi:hypothetical protein
MRVIAAGCLMLAGLALASCGVVGAKGNDTGGIIPWTELNEEHAVDIAQANCRQYGKHAVATSIHRVYGDYIGYACQWDQPVATPTGLQARP